MKKFLIIISFFIFNLHADEKVVLQLKWFHQFQFAGYYAALEKGFYSDEGLNVEIRERNLESDPIEQVLNNNAQYGVSDSVLFLYIAKNKPLQIVTPIFQHSPNVIITLKESGIDSPYKLNDKKITFYKKDTDGFGILGMFKTLHIYPHIERMRTIDDYKFLLTGEIDGYASYLTNEPFLLQKEGAHINIINPSNYGFDLYGDMLFTSTDEATNHPQRTEAFKRATIKGWKYALANKEELISLIQKKYNSKRSLELLRFEADALEYMIKPNLIPIGTLDKGRLTYITQLLQKHGLLDTSVQIDKYIFSTYAPTLNLTSDEKSFLARKREITMCIDPDWMPFEKLENETHIGMSSDYFKLLSQKLEIPIRVIPTKTWSQSLEFIKERKCDIFSLAMSTQERKEFMDFTNSYIRSPMVIITRLDELFIDNIEKLKAKKIGMIKGYAYTEILLSRYPYLEAVEFENLKDMLDAVKNKEIFAAVESIYTSGYYIQRDYVGTLKITGKFDEMWELGIATRNDEPLLQSIFNKALSSISPEQHQAINNKWIAVSYEEDKSYLTYLYWASGLLLFIGIILMIIMRVNKNLNKEVRTRKIAEEELQKLISLYENLSITDELTSLYNRRYFNEIFIQEINRSKRDKKSLSFMMLDVDYFKRYNDTYGHQKGDEALVEIARILSNHTKRAGDFAFRLGGEEFGIFLTSSSYEESLALAEHIRACVENSSIEHIGNENKKVITISIGLVYCTCSQSIDSDSFYKYTDNALYKAKNEGRNRVVAVLLS